MNGEVMMTAELGPDTDEGSDIAELIRLYPNDMTWEMCSECGDDVCIKAYGGSVCPTCGRDIFPCSMCTWESTMNNCGTEKCPYHKYEEVKE